MEDFSLVGMGIALIIMNLVNLTRLPRWSKLVVHGLAMIAVLLCFTTTVELATSGANRGIAEAIVFALFFASLLWSMRIDAKAAKRAEAAEGTAPQ